MKIAKGTNIIDQINAAREQEARSAVQQQILLQQALQSSDPDTLIKASTMAAQISQRSASAQKSVLVDPLELVGALGYKNRRNNITYELLRRMARVPVIHTIIATRVDQVAAFANPQTSAYDAGFVIRKKATKSNAKVGRKDQQIIDELTDFMVNCGHVGSAWHGDNFEQFLRKITADSLILDQLTFEVVRNRAGRLVEFFATDGSTYRIADSIDDEQYRRDQQKFDTKTAIRGYYPSYVQIISDQILNEFYPWELCFGVRNQTTDIRFNGYGVSELEILINTITSMLYSDQYNQRVFSQGSLPKGFLRVKGSIGGSSLQQLTQSWVSQVTGVTNAHRVPFIEGEDVEWVNMGQGSNRDMEYSKWQEYLIQVACAVYKMDPKEAGFSVGNLGSDSRPVFESSKEAYLEYSRDKGLRPLLRFIQFQINKYLIAPQNPDFEFAFMGLDSTDAQTDLENDIKSASSFMGLKEARRRRGLPDTIDDDDVILNPTFLQWKGMQQQQQADAAGGDQQPQDDQDQQQEEYDNDNQSDDGDQQDDDQQQYQYGDENFVYQ